MPCKSINRGAVRPGNERTPELRDRRVAKARGLLDPGTDHQKLDADSATNGRSTHDYERNGVCMDEMQGRPCGRVWRRAHSQCGASPLPLGSGGTA